MTRTTELRRSVLVGLASVAASVVLLVNANRHYPIQHWLVFHYLGNWALASVFTVACGTMGFAATRTILGRVLPIREMLTVSLAVGLLGYFLLAFTAGLLGLFGPFFAFVAPILMVAAGARPTMRYARRLRRHLRAAKKRRSELAHRSWVETVALALGFLSICLVYFSILSPRNASFDARWYHIPIAEHYADAGGIVRFPEGWVMGAFPQLTSLVYAWAFQIPVSLFGRLTLSAHLEFAIFLWTLFGVPALVRRLLPKEWRPRPRAATSWAAVFLFPGLFLYDSSLNLGADHVAAMWGVPIFLVLLRAWPSLAARECALLGVVLSGALLTKYTAVLLLGFPALAVAARALWLFIGRLRGRSTSSGIGGVAAVVFTGLILTSPHWLKNWLWYGDPLYPTFHSALVLRPWSTLADVPYHQDIQVAWHPTRDFDGLVETIRVMFTFAFDHHDWGDLHGSAPVFGFLFTLTMLCLPFLGVAKRLWALYLAGNLGVVVWCTINWQDRYLQALVPWMAAAVAATAIRMWRLRLPAQIGVALLVALQIVWGSDVYFFTTHRMIGSPVIAAIELLNTARAQKLDSRARVFPENQPIAEALPPGAHPLVHESRQTIGMMRRRVHDRPGTQGLLYYEKFRSPRAIYDQLRALGITHVIHGRLEGVATLGSEIAFQAFARRHTEGQSRHGAFFIARMPAAAPPDEPFGDVAFLGCDGSYARGLYRLGDLSVSPFDPAPQWPAPSVALDAEHSVEELLAAADFAVVGCAPNVQRRILGAFVSLTPYRGNDILFARRNPR